MKIYCNQETLLANITTVLRACSTRTSMPILECIFIQAMQGQITLMGNNLELGIESTFDADIVEEGSVAIEAKIFSEIIRKMPHGDIEITLLPQNMVTIINGKSKFTIFSFLLE